MPRQLPNAPRAHPQPPEFSRKRHAPLPRHRGSVPVSRSCPRVAGRLHTCDSPVRRSPPARCRAALPLDLHVLGLSLAFILSQDQTLHCKCLFCYFHCPRQGFLASRKKTCRTPVAACLSSSHPCQRIIRVKEPRSPSSFPPSPKDRSQPESGCKDKPIFSPNPNFSPTFLRKNPPQKPNRLENNGEQECFFSGWTRSSGRRPSDSGNKAPPHRHARQGRAPRRVGKPGHGTHGLKISGEQPRESPWFPLRNPPTTGDGARRASSARAGSADRPCPQRKSSLFVGISSFLLVKSPSIKKKKN